MTGCCPLLSLIDLRDVRLRLRVLRPEQRLHQPLGLPVLQDPAALPRRPADDQQPQVRGLRQGAQRTLRPRPLRHDGEAQEGPLPREGHGQLQRPRQEGGGQG